MANPLPDQPSTALHELVAFARERGWAVDIALYSDRGDSALSTYEGGARLTGFEMDPMDVIANGLKQVRLQAASDDEREECFACHGKGKFEPAADEPPERQALTCAECDGTGLASRERQGD